MKVRCEECNLRIGERFFGRSFLWICYQCYIEKPFSGRVLNFLLDFRGAIELWWHDIKLYGWRE